MEIMAARPLVLILVSLIVVPCHNLSVWMVLVHNYAYRQAIDLPHAASNLATIQLCDNMTPNTAQMMAASTIMLTGQMQMVTQQQQAASALVRSRTVQARSRLSSRRSRRISMSRSRTTF
mmetsp:Transcript_34774/g.75415  ORF Transcript_34774/g.75415 Transcript_34774/m.75415 type:complete len:120 (+) Transcript_34774:442-801(+)